MVNDKININIPSFNLRLSTILPIILVLFLGFTTFKQWNATKELRQENKALDSANKGLLNVVLDINKQIEADSIFIANLSLRIDSLNVRDSIRIKQYNTISWRYEKLKQDYNSATSDDKWDIFTNTINN